MSEGRDPMHDLFTEPDEKVVEMVYRRQDPAAFERGLRVHAEEDGWRIRTFSQIDVAWPPGRPMDSEHTLLCIMERTDK